MKKRPRQPVASVALATGWRDCNQGGDNGAKIPHSPGSCPNDAS